MPLTTQHADGRRIDSTDDEQWAEVHHPGYKGLTCPECGYGMYAREPSDAIRHFAHNAGRPESCSLGEGAEHLHVKVLIAEAVQGLTGWTAEQEVFGDGWRADVLATSPSGQRRIAFEPQMTGQHASKARERTERRTASGVETVWLDKTRRGELAGLPRARLSYNDGDPRVGVQTVNDAGRWQPHMVTLSQFVQSYCLGTLTLTDGFWATSWAREEYAKAQREREQRRTISGTGWTPERAAQVRLERDLGRDESVQREAEHWAPTAAMSDEELVVLTQRFLDEPKPFPGWIPAGDRIHGALARRGLLHD